jgi:hypothetical protein
MFDPKFKSLRVVENYVGPGACIYLIVEYDVNAVIPLLMTMFEVLNLTIQACAVKVVGYVARFGDSIEEDNNIFSIYGRVITCTCCWEVVLVQEVISIPCCIC